MKRIAAITAVVLALLAVPATAMASTAYCQPLGGQIHGCQQRTMTFNMAAFGRTATEVKGPRLSAGEVVIYRHQIYTIGAVWNRHFTLDQRGSSFRNGSSPIWHASATVLAGRWSAQ